MDADLALVLGLAVAVFSIPAIVSALSDGRTPRVAAIAVMIGGGMMVWAISQRPGGYPLGEIPATVVKVVARYLP